MTAISDLSFVARRDGKTLPKRKAGEGGFCYWHVTPTGNYHADCIAGEKLALEYLAYEEANYTGGTLQHIVGDMPREMSGLEIGFFTMVSFAAQSGANRARHLSTYWEKCRRELESPATV